MTVRWKEAHLPAILPNYELEDIFNADEFGLFFQVLPNKNLKSKEENVVVVNTAKSDSPEYAQRVLQYI